MLQDYGYQAIAWCSRLHFPASTGTHCAHPRMDSQAELAWVAGHTLRWFARPKTVTHPGTNRTRTTLWM